MNEAAYWDLRIASMDRRIQRKTAPQVSSVHERPEMKREVRKANAVMNELDLPWGALFDSLEYAASHDVALLSFQPDASSRKMRIGGEAKNMSGHARFCRRAGARIRSARMPIFSSMRSSGMIRIGRLFFPLRHHGPESFLSNCLLRVRWQTERLGTPGKIGFGIACFLRRIFCCGGVATPGGIEAR